MNVGGSVLYWVSDVFWTDSMHWVVFCDMNSQWPSLEDNMCELSFCIVSGLKRCQNVCRCQYSVAYHFVHSSIVKQSACISYAFISVKVWRHCRFFQTTYFLVLRKKLGVIACLKWFSFTHKTCYKDLHTTTEKLDQKLKYFSF